jgi:uncharacterized membrane protein
MTEYPGIISGNSHGNFDPHGAPTPVNIEAIIMNGFIFLIIFAWYEFLRTWYDNTFKPNGDYALVWNGLVFVVFVTVLLSIAVYVTYNVYETTKVV